jgi:type 2 lantibiotic biosynthesis protein LanM
LTKPIGVKSADPFYQRLMLRAATIDELLCDEFEAGPGGNGEADLAGQRLAAWCKSSASGDWSLFERRLERDGLSRTKVMERLSGLRRRASVPPPEWLADAIWIEAALHGAPTIAEPNSGPDRSGSFPFEQLFGALVEQAEILVWSGLEARVRDNLDDSARARLRQSLLTELSELSTPAIYERFAEARKAGMIPAAETAPSEKAGTAHYDQFIADMRARGFRRLFEDKPVLLRLLATLTRQWIDTSREFVLRLDADLTTIRRTLLRSETVGRVVKIEGDLSDPHNNGHSVRIVSFEDGSRVVYKPKDLRLDVAWQALIGRLNDAGPPLELKSVRAVARDGYGWTEFADHIGCADANGCKEFFRRAGAWLALFHCFAATDMHQENVIAVGDHPVPIDLETILQAAPDDDRSRDPEAQAFEAAMARLGNSVMMVGLLPAYARSVDHNVFAMGGMTADWGSRTVIAWRNINSDAMRPVKVKETAGTNPNLPHVAGRYARFADHTESFVAGFEDYAKFLLRWLGAAAPGALFDGFAGLPVRKIIRPTRFYYMLLQRLRNNRTMDDGASWSTQADFIARLADWEKDSEPLWPLQRAERSALLALNVPHFVIASDGNEIRDATGVLLRTDMISDVASDAASGMDRARARVWNFDEQDVAWQIEIIRENTYSAPESVAHSPPASTREETSPSAAAIAPSKEVFVAEADKIAAELSRHAIRRGPGAAWIGLDWLGDSEVFQLVCLGPDLYNGVSGIAVFFAAHAAVTRCGSSGELALAAIAHLRKNLKSRNAARMARSLGVGGATGLGSIVYALAAIAKFLHSDDVLADAHHAAGLFTDDIIAVDKRLDVTGGSAGAILGLLRLYRDSQSADVLARATKIGEHLLGQKRLGSEGARTWVGQGSGAQPLNGMSHGAAGYAYALASLSAATGRPDFAQAAVECIAFENSSYDSGRRNWPDLRGGGEPSWPFQWCHGAPGIGLARAATLRRGEIDSTLLTTDIRNAVEGVQRAAPGQLDTLCCGTLGRVEFFRETGRSLGRDDLCELASRQLSTVLARARESGDYRWNGGKRQFNLGLFRGLAGVGYTMLRQVDGSLPNVIIWE